MLVSFIHSFKGNPLIWDVCAHEFVELSWGPFHFPFFWFWIIFFFHWKHFWRQNISFAHEELVNHYLASQKGLSKNNGLQINILNIIFFLYFYFVLSGIWYIFIIISSKIELHLVSLKDFIFQRNFCQSWFHSFISLG